MKFQESAARLEEIARGFNDATTSLAGIFYELKLASGITVPEGSVGTAKYAASAALISEIETVMQQAANPDQIAVAIQLARIGACSQKDRPPEIKKIGHPFAKRSATLWKSARMPLKPYLGRGRWAREGAYRGEYYRWRRCGMYCNCLN